MGELTEKAIAKLEEELKNAKNKDFAEAVIKEFLMQRVSESDTFAEAVMQEHKAWAKCEDYIQNKAKQQAKGQHSIAIRNDVVYEWAEDYFRLDDKAIEEAKKKEAEEKAKKQAAEKKEPKPKTPKEKEQVPEVPKPVKESRPKEDSQLSGQMSIFDLMGV